MVKGGALMQSANLGFGNSPHRLRSKWTSLCAILPAFAVLTTSNTVAHAAERVTPVKLWIAGKIVALKSSAVYDGKETFVPLEALASVGAKGTVTSTRNVVRITLRTGKREDLDYATYQGKPYVSLTDLAETVDGKVLKPVSARSGLLASKYQLPNTTYLLARVTDVRVEGTFLHVGTSFPVPFKSNLLRTDNPRGYVDVIGAVVSKDLRAVSLKSRRYAERVRFGQFTPDISRIVVDLAPGARLSVNAGETRPTATYTASLTGGSMNGPGLTHSSSQNNSEASSDELILPNRRRAPMSDDTVAPPRRNRVTDASVVTPRRKKAAVQPDDANLQTEPVSPPRRRSASQQDDGAYPAATTNFKKQVTEIERITYRAEDAESIQLIVTTTAKARAFVHYSAATRQVIIDIPNSQLNLDNDQQSDQDISNSLITGLTASTQRKSPRIAPLTRIKLDASKPVTVSQESTENQIVFDITPPRSANAHVSGTRKLVVIDAGHGGFDNGANVMENGKLTSEKNITLAIASRLRTCLEASGVKVRMTRSSDSHVALEARPALANEVGADLYISIHNDTWKRANAISGNTTYYHAESPQSRALAVYVQQSLAPVSGMRNRGALTDTSLYANGLAVLRETNMPAILCEIGYINNANDRRQLLNGKFQSRVALAICKGVRNYLAANTPVATARRRKRAMKTV